MALAGGDFIALLDHDDELHPHALYHFVEALNRAPEADLFYSDEDHIDKDSYRSDPFFKPDWSPDLLLSEDYVSHLMIFRRSLCDSIGGFRAEFEPSQDYDLLLRLSRTARDIVHIPRILYHWRTEVRSFCRVSERGEAMAGACQRIVEDHLQAAGAAARVEPTALPLRFRIRYPIPDGQQVRVLVGTSGKPSGLDSFMRSVVANTEFPRFDIRVVEIAGNHAASYNAAARDFRDGLLLFLDAGLSPIAPDWMTAMSEVASREDVGAVGAMLLTPDETIQHAGIVLGIRGSYGCAFQGTPAASRVYFDFPHVIRNVSAVSGACMLVPADRFWECGGFDADVFGQACYDVDLCLRLGEAGYRILFTPYAQLRWNSQTCPDPTTQGASLDEIQVFRDRWRARLECDPYYSRNLTRAAGDYSYRKRQE